MMQELEVNYSAKYSWINDQMIKYRDLYHATMQQLSMIQHEEQSKLRQYESVFIETQTIYTTQIT